METITFSSFKEYILFMYVHIAFADGVVQIEEKSLILKKLQRYFESEEAIISNFEKMLITYQQMKEQADVIIKNHVKTFSNIEFYKKYKVFRDLYEIIEADGIVEECESEALDKLKIIIGYELETR